MLQWELWVHLILCSSSLVPHIFTHAVWARWAPILVWAFYNTLPFVPARSSMFGGRSLGLVKASFENSLNGLITPRVLPVLSISFLLIALSLSTTGATLGGAPLCYKAHKECLADWDNAVSVADYTSDPYAPAPDPYKVQHGYINGKELSAFRTMVQVAFSLFMSTIMALVGCLAWKVADDEVLEQQAAAEWLSKEDYNAWTLREDLLRTFGAPGSDIRPDGSPSWVVSGITSSMTFVLLGWHNWYVSASASASVSLSRTH